MTFDEQSGGRFLCAVSAAQIEWANDDLDRLATGVFLHFCKEKRLPVNHHDFKRYIVDVGCYAIGVRHDISVDLDYVDVDVSKQEYTFCITFPPKADLALLQGLTYRARWEELRAKDQRISPIALLTPRNWLRSFVNHHERPAA